MAYPNMNTQYPGNVLEKKTNEMRIYLYLFKKGTLLILFVLFFLI